VAGPAFWYEPDTPSSIVSRIEIANRGQHTAGLEKGFQSSRLRSAALIPPAIELGVTDSRQNALTVTSARAHTWDERHGTKRIAGGAFCHADVRVGGIEAAERKPRRFWGREESDQAGQ
jgi:hypothetical protein